MIGRLTEGGDVSSATAVNTHDSPKLQLVFAFTRVHGVTFQKTAVCISSTDVTQRSLRDREGDTVLRITGGGRGGVRGFRSLIADFSILIFRRVSQSCETRLLASSCLSVCPHGTNRLPIDGFSWNLTHEYFSKICQKISCLVKMWQEKQALYMKIHIHFSSSLSQFLEWEIFRQAL